MLVIGNLVLFLFLFYHATSINQLSKIEKKFSEKERLQDTMVNTYERTADGKIKCPHCDYTRPVKNMSSVCMHIKAKHSGAFKHKCSDCNYETAIKQNLENHILAKHPETSDKAQKELNCPCTDCQYVTHKKGQLRSHYILKHMSKQLEDITGKTEDGHLQCTHCGTLFPSKPAFVYHSINCFSNDIMENPEVRKGVGLVE